MDDGNRRAAAKNEPLNQSPSPLLLFACVLFIESIFGVFVSINLAFIITFFSSLPPQYTKYCQQNT